MATLGWHSCNKAFPNDVRVFNPCTIDQINLSSDSDATYPDVA